MVMFLTDSHAHIDYDSYDTDRDEMLGRAQSTGVQRILNIALGPESEKFEKAFSLFELSKDISIAVGVHPHDAGKMDEDAYNKFKAYAARSGVSALGEIGLDYYYENSPREAQVKWFGRFLDLALELKLPVTIHSRDAFDDTYEAVSKRDIFRKVGGVLHCFTGTAEEAKKFLDLGAYISFSGIITFKKAEELRQTAKSVPIEKMLIETDAPFLTPDPYRGKRNEPAYVLRVAETIAALKGLSVEEVAKITSENAARLFRF
jgi:TatD DNase family protein